MKLFFVAVADDRELPSVEGTLAASVLHIPGSPSREEVVAGVRQLFTDVAQHLATSTPERPGG